MRYSSMGGVLEMEKACDRKDGKCLSGSTVTNLSPCNTLSRGHYKYICVHTLSEIGVMYDLLCRNSVVKGDYNDEDAK